MTPWVRRWLLFAAVSSAALFAGGWTATRLPLKLEEPAPAGWTADKIVRDRYHLRLIQPEWVSRTPDWQENWMTAEIRVRLLLILIAWSVAVTFISNKPLEVEDDRRAGP